MDQDLQNSPVLDYSNDGNPKYLTGLSTILVATLQEVKDRISQIEFIFCSQLFPNFQAELVRSRTNEKKQTKSFQDAEDEWKQKEKSLLLLIENLQLEKKHAQEQIMNMQTSLEQEQAKLTGNGQLLTVSEMENKQLRVKLESVQNGEVAELREQLRQKTEEMLKVKELHEKQLKQVKLERDELTINLSVENRAKNDAISKFKYMKDRYRSLSSQYTFVRDRFGLSTEKHLHCDMVEEERHLHSQRTLQDPKDEDPSTNHRTLNTKEHKKEGNLQDSPETNRGTNDSKFRCSNIKTPPSTSPQPQKCCIDIKFKSTIGPKHNSSWRDTRSRQELGGADPHDDFLDTPMENVKENLNKTPKEVLDLPAPAPKDMDFDNSEEETQETVAGPAPQKHPPPIPKPVKRGYKYVEPVRKKAERENLKGVECRQCKKFYDAVLPNDANNNSNNIKNSVYNNIRCEHHDGVSRHRYRYAPPSTPEGFWNIGFDSDL